MAGKLTPKQEKFCQEYIQCGNASDAYRAAYDCSKMLPQTVNRAAFGLFNNSKITTRIKDLRDKAAEAAMVTLQGHLNDLKRLRDAAEADQQYSAAITAEISRGKAAGLYAERIIADVQSRVVDFETDSNS